MFSSKVRLILALTFFLVYGKAVKSSEVIDITSESFDATVQEGRWFIKFYAPWCGHCKKLAPKFEKLATDLKGQVSFGKIDVTQYSDIKRRFDIKGFPSLFYFENGVKVLKYSGSREEDVLLRFCKKMIVPPLDEIETLPEFWLKMKTNQPHRSIENSPISFVLGWDEKAPLSGKAYNKIHDIAKQKRSSHFFFVTKDEEVKDLLCSSCTQAFLARFENGEKVMTYPFSLEDSSIEDIEAWISRYSFPHFKELDGSMFNSMANTKNQKMVVCIFDANKLDNQITRTYLESMGQLARPESTTLSESARSQLLFAKLDGNKFVAFVEDYGIDEETLPRTLVIDGTNSLYYEDVFAENDVETFLEQIVKGEARPHYDGIWKTPARSWRSFKRYMPWSLLLALLALSLLVFMCYLICWVELEDYDELEFSDDENKETKKEK